LEAAWKAIFRRHSQSYGHAYTDDWQLLDVDMSGMPCGKKAAMAAAGYFATPHNRRGRQLGRVMATRTRESVVDRLVDGKSQVNTALLPLVVAAEATLELDAAQRQRTLVRIDAGAGSISDVNWLLMRGYFLATKDYSTARAWLLAKQVTDWIIDTRDSERQGGLLPVPATDYHAGQYQRSITRVAVRCRLATERGAWAWWSPPCRSLTLTPWRAWSPAAPPIRRWRCWPTSISMTSAAARWRPPSRRTSRG
jgi:hypothetical protein